MLSTLLEWECRRRPSQGRRGREQGAVTDAAAEGNDDDYHTYIKSHSERGVELRLSSLYGVLAVGECCGLWVGESSASSASDFHDIDFHHGDGDDLESRKIAKRAASP